MTNKFEYLKNLNGHLVLSCKDLEELLKHFNLERYMNDITGAIVLIYNGNYDKVWFTEDSKPWNNYAQYFTIDYWKENT